MPVFSVLHHLLEFTQTHVHQVSDVILPSHFLPSLSSYLQSFPIGIFSNESVLCIRWPKYWSFSFSISSSNEYSGLISIKIDWFELHAAQGTLKSLLQHNNLATWLEEPTHWKRLWCWERLKAGGEGGNRGWDGWMASQTQLKWVWANSRRWWWTGKPGVLQSMGSQRVRHNWATEQQ